MSRRKKIVLLALSPVLLAAIWLLGVDRRWVMEHCSACGLHRDIHEVRLFRLPVWRGVEEYTGAIQLAAQDLGRPCDHERMTRGVKARWLGAAWRVYWNEQEYLYFTNLWHDEPARRAIAALAATRPHLPEEFHRRVIQHGEIGYWSEFIGQVEAGRSPATQPAR